MDLRRRCLESSGIGFDSAWSRLLYQALVLRNIHELLLKHTTLLPELEAVCSESTKLATLRFDCREHQA
eukprot:CAMPEP_0172670076 /NCGR_PEP_ID=MMETSP1074-20121228/10080_1 /TAXON_ID=2916 /ORGANISM="Ceratium fusus, Strain PA161109" /LENGTH=68 /DNA_ID=CAMNT_0013486941 /DNA_START=213 /DNA_END=416 /DNA_ORIENTATION=+